MESLLAIGLFVALLTWLLATGRSGGPAAGTGEGDCFAGPGRASSRAVAAVCGVCLAIGCFLRLYGIQSSLWLDEFGTLWVIDIDLVPAIERVFAFQGQSPVYYLLARQFLGLFGESEFVLRLPSLLFAACSALVLFRAGEEWVDRRTGLVASALAWLSPVMVEAGASARPYALGLLGESIAIYGFIRAVRRGDWIGRLLLVAGGALLFAAHYVLVLPMVGLAAAYLLSAETRRLYSPRMACLDGGALILLCLPGLPQLAALRARGEALSWLGEPDFYMIFESAGALLVLALAGLLAGGKRESAGTKGPLRMALWLAAAAHAGGLALLSLSGDNLMDTRYLVAIVPPAALLAAEGILRLPGRVALIPLGYAVSLTALFFAMHFLISGSFSRVGRQDWRGAVESIEARRADSDPPLVLFRSGFVEAEGVLEGFEEPVLKAPLRSPGTAPTDWQLVELNYRWDSPERSNYFQTSITPAIEKADRFFLLLCDNCYNETTGDYPNGIRSWIKQRFPGEFSELRISAGRGILLFEYQRSGQGDSGGDVARKFDNTRVPR